MTYATGVVLAISTVWFVYYVSTRRLPRNSSRTGKVEKDTSSEAPSKTEAREHIMRENNGRVASNTTELPSFQITEGHDTTKAAKPPSHTYDASPSEQRPSAPTSSAEGLDTKSEDTSPQKPATKVATSMLPPPIPQLRPPSFSQTPSRMLPPPRPSGSSLCPPPSSASSLRAPARPQSLTASTLPANGKASSRAVVLAPGHSPLDWATLTHDSKATKILRGHDATRLSMALFSSPHTFLHIPPTTLRRFNGRKGRDAWTSYNGKVYNITAYLPFHPGGEPEILKGAGRGSEKLFADIHPWVNWDGMLNECVVGILVSEEDGRAVKVDREGMLLERPEDVGTNPLDEMD